MRYKGVVKRNAVILEEGVHLPDGVRVAVMVEQVEQVEVVEVHPVPFLPLLVPSKDTLPPAVASEGYTASFGSPFPSSPPP